uniref:Uncharacterized protein n=1 Tax=Anguilla anguilla TaxID=7936 RepID=A0A0E9VXI8_ANGAN
MFFFLFCFVFLNRHFRTKPCYRELCFDSCKM